MKILVAGDWQSDIHESAVADALIQLGHVCVRFPWVQYFRSNAFFENIVGRVQNKYLLGPAITKINNDFVLTVCRSKPDLIFIYRGTHITPDSLQQVKKFLPKTIIVGYNNDDPFAQYQSKFLWRHFVASIPLYDLVLAYRHHNLSDFIRAGAQRVELLRSWFLPERNYPCTLTPEETARFGCDVVFAGHFEPDGRDKIIERLINEGFNLKLYGPEWTNVVSKSMALQNLAPVVPARGEDYNKALCGAKIALCMLSKLNRDTYTRRCFEIPASGTFMLSEYSDDLSHMFREGAEAEFFRSEEELVKKLRKYLTDDMARIAIANAGRERVRADGHDIVSRMRCVLEWVSDIK